MTQGTQRLGQRWRAYWSAWWDARLQRKDQVLLTQRNLYILPTRAGWSLAAVFVVLLLASINEQLNLGYALSFTLGSAALAAIHQTHANLQGVSLHLLGLRSVHAGHVVRMSVVMSHTLSSRGRYGLKIHAGTRATEDAQQGPGSPIDVELRPASDSTVELDVVSTARGWMSMPRITLETRYPLGIFRAWSYWRPLSQVLVWPALDDHAPPLPQQQPQATPLAGRHVATQSLELPEGLRDYRRGDSFKLIAWKKSSQVLASGGLVSREPASARSPDLWLDFDNSAGLQSLGAEARLSRLASWLYVAETQAQNRGGPYGLKLPGLIVPCAMGTAHLRTCLDALATWHPAP